MNPIIAIYPNITLVELASAARLLNMRLTYRNWTLTLEKYYDRH